MSTGQSVVGEAMLGELAGGLFNHKCREDCYVVKE